MPSFGLFSPRRSDFHSFPARIAMSRESEHPGASSFRRLDSMKKRGENANRSRRRSRRGVWDGGFIGLLLLSSGSYSSVRASNIVFIELE